eukprot:Seg2379.4 transcript_id=Seg2379.4/GoldUCD/mRNA.D3Y31 product="Carnosine N-methyltransferase 2" protein_id=Seg2379.4/GoldUCD/D3Y31
MAATRTEVKPLTPEEYQKDFQAFIESTTQHEYMLGMIGPVVESFKGEAIDLMSIGAGTGCFENDLITKLGLNVSYFHAIEPNEDHREQLKQKMVSWENIKFTVDQNYFTENYEIKHKFDLVVMAHCLYSMDNVDQVILKARSLLNDDGKLAIFVKSDEGITELYEHMIKYVKYSAKPISDEAVCSKSVCEILTSNSIDFVLKEGVISHDITDFVKQINTTAANAVISFVLQTRFENLPQDVQNILYEMVMQRVKCNNIEQSMYSDVTCMILVS